MKTNQLINKVKIGENQTVGIYELTESQAKKYAGGKRYFLSSGIFSDYAFKHMTDDELLGSIKPWHYEGFFDTAREAYIQAKLMRADTIISVLSNALKEIKIPEFSWDVEFEKQGKEEAE